MPYGITQCYLPPGSGDFPAFTPAETSIGLLDLSTPEGCKAELTYAVVTFQDSLPLYLLNTVNYLRNNQTVS